ncbi:MAG: ATP-binding protein [Pseudonocardiaceae bacterium]
MPRQLPADVRKFVNRAEELHRLNEILVSDKSDLFVASVYVIVGTAGAGKTSLALHWAHQVLDRFPDGQLYINLRGYDPGEPISALTALHRFLAALGVPAPAIPVETEAAAAMYRSVLADRHILIMLDNAATVSQVRPLLPGYSRCLAIVTSRSRLSGLAVHDGAQRLTIGMLAEPECIALLRAVTAGYRPEDDEEKLADLARLCAQLPLALRIAGERAASHPHMRLEELISDLRDQSALWDALSIGEGGEEDAVRSVFTWSYRSLSPDSARLFRLLGLHPGPDFGIGAVCALARISVRRTRQLLDGLVAAHMLEQTAPDRYEFHDLLRAYAIDQARVEESHESRIEALRRVLDWYLYTADAAQIWIMPARDRVPLDVQRDSVSHLSFSDYDHAVDWAEREHSNFMPAVRAALEAGFDRYTWQLSLVLWSAKAPSAVATDWLAIGQIGLHAAHRLGERAGEAALLRSLGFTYVKTNQMTESLEGHKEALAIWRELGDQQGEAASLNAIGMAYLRWRRLGAAETHFKQARAVFQKIGSAHWEAVVLVNLATVRYQAGRLIEAADDIRQAQIYHRENGNKRNIGNALHLLSGIHLDRGELHEALAAAHEAHELALDLRSHVLEGYWLLTLGDTQQSLGQFAEALASYHRSAVLHRRLGDRSREALAWHGAGNVYQRLNREGEAAEFHRRAAAVQNQLGYPWYEAMALDGLAAALQGVDIEQSRQRWSEALRLLADYDDPRTEGIRQHIEGRLAELR